MPKDESNSNGTKTGRNNHFGCAIVSIDKYVWVRVVEETIWPFHQNCRQPKRYVNNCAGHKWNVNFCAHLNKDGGEFACLIFPYKRIQFNFALKSYCTLFDNTDTDFHLQNESLFIRIYELQPKYEMHLLI